MNAELEEVDGYTEDSDSDSWEDSGSVEYTDEEYKRDDSESDSLSDYYIGDAIIKRAIEIENSVKFNEADRTNEIVEMINGMNLTTKDVAEAYGLKFEFGYEGESFMAPTVRKVTGLFDSVVNIIFSLPLIRRIKPSTFTYPPRESRRTQKAIGNMIGYVSAFVENEKFWMNREGNILLDDLDYYPTVKVFNKVLRYSSKCKGWGEALKEGYVTVDELFTKIRDAQAKAQEIELEVLKSQSKSGSSGKG